MPGEKVFYARIHMTVPKRRIDEFFKIDQCWVLSTREVRGNLVPSGIGVLKLPPHALDGLLCSTPGSTALGAVVAVIVVVVTFAGFCSRSFALSWRRISVRIRRTDFRRNRVSCRFDWRKRSGQRRGSRCRFVPDSGFCRRTQSALFLFTGRRYCVDVVLSTLGS